MIGPTQRSNGFANVARLTSDSGKVERVSRLGPNAGGDNQVSEAASGAAQALSNNPSLRAFRGESGFDGVQGNQMGVQGFSVSDWVMRKRQLEQFDGLKSRVASLKVALRKDGPLPKGAGHSGVPPMGGTQTPKSRLGETPKADSSSNPKSPTPVAGTKELKPAQPVQPSGPVDPLDRVLQVLEGILQAQEQAKAAGFGGI
jgi:hypothetical protein